MPPKKAYYIMNNKRAAATTTGRPGTTRTKSAAPTPNELAKLELAKAISVSIPEDQIMLYEYAIFPEYYEKINTNILDYADVILTESPYNGSIAPLNVDDLTPEEQNAYIAHLKSVTKLKKHQYNFNNEWVPNGNATFPKNYKAAAIVDMALVKDNKIIEMWFVTASNDNIPTRVKNILDIGYSDVPIYYIHPAIINTHSDLPHNELYKKALELATQVNSKYLTNSDPMFGPNYIEANDSPKAIMVLAKFIREYVPGSIPCIKYPILEKYGNLLIDHMVDDFASKLLKYKPYKNSTTPLDINKLSQDDRIHYLKHLKSIAATDQEDLNEYWIPNKHIQMVNLGMLRGVVDIAITDGDVINELWDICVIPENNEKRIASIKSAGFSHVPMYQISSKWLIDNKKNKNLYELAKENALKLN
jgi:hypothetical protein